jgi:uncharacterized membrane protein YkvA (DUF1232 family)
MKVGEYILGKDKNRKARLSKIVTRHRRKKLSDEQIDELSEIDRKKSEELYEVTKAKSELLFEEPEKSLSIIEKAVSKVKLITKGKFKDVYDEFILMTDLVRAYMKREYTDISKKSILAMLGGIVYVFNPMDIIPDVIPLTGYLDDASVIAMILKQLGGALDKYKLWLQDIDPIGPNINQKIDETIGKINESILNMQIMLIFKFVLYTVILIVALIVRTYIPESSIPIFLIGIVYLFIFIILVRNIIRWIKIYNENSMQIRKYMPKYYDNMKNNSYRDALTLLVKEYADEEIFVEKEEYGKIKNIGIRIAKQFKNKNKHVERVIEIFYERVTEEVLQKIDKVLKKRIIVYLISFSFYIVVVFLSNKFIIEYYYEGSWFLAIIYPFRYFFIK